MLAPVTCCIIIDYLCIEISATVRWWSEQYCADQAQLMVRRPLRSAVSLCYVPSMLSCYYYHIHYGYHDRDD